LCGSGFWRLAPPKELFNHYLIFEKNQIVIGLLRLLAAGAAKRIYYYLIGLLCLFFERDYTPD
jgi:hypothetical protein